MTKEKLLKQIVDLEFRAGELNNKLRNKCSEYANEYADWEINDRVLVKQKDNNKFVCYGKIAIIRFDGHDFIYSVSPTKKNGNINKANYSYIIISTQSFYIIEKYHPHE